MYYSRGFKEKYNIDAEILAILFSVSGVLLLLELVAWHKLLCIGTNIKHWQRK